MQAKLHRLLFYTLVLGVYGIFFSVECFYNFEGQGSSSNQLHRLTVAKEGANAAAVFQTLPVRSRAAYSLRLNKRFHQEDALPVALLSPVLPEYVLAPQMPGCSCHTDLSAPAFLHRPLRGPPSLG
jgi:hypothetical protein